MLIRVLERQRDGSYERAWPPRSTKPLWQRMAEVDPELLEATQWVPIWQAEPTWRAKHPALFDD